MSTVAWTAAPAASTCETTGRRPLQRLFEPASIAVVGASAKPGKLGATMFRMVASTCDDAAVFGINPRATGERFHASLEQATHANGGPIDLAICCVPAHVTPAVIQDAADCGVHTVLICSGGFAESGAEGAELQSDLTRIVEKTGIRVLGPNTSGFFCPGRTIASFVPAVEHLQSGPVAVIAASGGMNHALSFLLSDNNIGVGFGVGLGNAVDVGLVDALEHAAMRDDITAVALHVESVTDGPRLLEAIRRTSRVKPVVAIVVGRSDVSGFAQSHTGALATEWKTTRALLSEAGAVIVDDERQLVDAMAALSRTRLPALENPGVGIVTAQAGPGLMVLDALLEAGVRVPELRQQSRDRLAALLPSLTFQKNPVDTGRPGAGFSDILATVAADEQVDAVAVYALAENDVIDLVDAVKTSGIAQEAAVALSVGGPMAEVRPILDDASAAQLPAFVTPAALVCAVTALVEDARGRWMQGLNEQARTPAKGARPIPAHFDLPLHEAGAKDLLDALGVRTPPRVACADRAAAHAALDALVTPVAVKLLDASVLHKSDRGGVHLNVASHEALDEALDALDRIEAPACLVESMSEPGVDLFLGIRRDAVFGPIIVAGLGGTAAEAMGDIAIRSAQATPASVMAMLDDLQTRELLDGWRGGPVLNRPAFADIALGLANYLNERPDIGEIEINPLRLTHDGLMALDAVVLAR